ncbi:MAG: 4,5-DOPA dioxygenase extradiol [Bacteroidales bacterium]
MTGSLPLKSLNDLSSTDRMPVLFVGHGNPMNAIEDNEFSRKWKELGKQLPRPAAILCISAHWETKGSFVTKTPRPETIHDFYGFPPDLFSVQYPAPGDPVLAAAISNEVKYQPVREDSSWGLDHGCWSILTRMFPDADIPVMQLSLDHYLSPEGHYRLARELSFLRRKGVLVMGSGNMVHNLRMFDFFNPARKYDWAEAMNEKFKTQIIANNNKFLTTPSEMGSAFSLAAPSLEHYLPMLYALALREKDESPEFFNDTVMSSLSMTSFILG